MLNTSDTKSLLEVAQEQWHKPVGLMGALILALSLARSAIRLGNVKKVRDDENSSYRHQHTYTTDKILWSGVTVTALSAIGLGIFIPWYFNNLGGIPIPVHCGGK